MARRHPHRRSAAAANGRACSAGCGSRPNVTSIPQPQLFQHARAADDPQRTGICCSGGGLRSAAFSFGALDVLWREGIVKKLDYLAGVSGGSYAVTAANHRSCPLRRRVVVEGQARPVRARFTRARLPAQPHRLPRAGVDGPMEHVPAPAAGNPLEPCGDPRRAVRRRPARRADLPVGVDDSAACKDCTGALKFHGWSGVVIFGLAGARAGRRLGRPAVQTGRGLVVAKAGALVRDVRLPRDHRGDRAARHPATDLVGEDQSSSAASEMQRSSPMPLVRSARQPARWRCRSATWCSVRGPAGKAAFRRSWPRCRGSSERCCRSSRSVSWYPCRWSTFFLIAIDSGTRRWSKAATWWWVGVLAAVLAIFAFGNPIAWSAQPFYKRRLRSVFALSSARRTQRCRHGRAGRRRPGTVALRPSTETVAAAVDLRGGKRLGPRVHPTGSRA